ncbi:MAG: MerR family transcriptional regulator [Treponema sp.]|jgi:DNA-binding transcriptional MerR regulator|nr:MerR family transcriptional regulator [Treponema sp.]
MSRSYTIAEAEKLLKVKPHVIRYWEKEVPFVQPHKDLGGHKLYSERDLQILLRLKYLLYERRFTLEGAKEELLGELSGKYQNLHGEIAALRSQLMELYFAVKK